MQGEPPTKRAKAPHGEECQQLLAWVEEAGGTIGNIEIHSEPGLERGIYASADLKAGDVLFELPNNLIITAETALNSALGQYLAANCQIVKSCAEETVGGARFTRKGRT